MENRINIKLTQHWCQTGQLHPTLLQVSLRSELDCCYCCEPEPSSEDGVPPESIAALLEVPCLVLEVLRSSTDLDFCKVSSMMIILEGFQHVAPTVFLLEEP